MGAFRIQAMIYSLIALAAYLGLICGVIIAKMAEEELDDGRKYFLIVQNILLGTITFFLSTFFLHGIIMSIILAMVITAIGFILDNVATGNTKTVLAYTLLAIPFFLSYKANIRYPLLITFPVISSCIFLYGLPTGSLLIQKKNRYLTIILFTIAFLPLSIILFFALRTLSL
jgi:hypothetical protein